MFRDSSCVSSCVVSNNEELSPKFFLIVPILAIFFAFSSELVFAESKQIFFGSSKIEITPPAGTPLSGFGRRHGKPSKGIHDSLYSRAISLTKDRITFIFVSLDLVLVDRDLRAEIVKKVRTEADIPDSNIMIFATHTHSGSGAIGKQFWQRFIEGKFQKECFREMTSLIAKSIVDSTKNQTPVQVDWGETDATSLVENRMDVNLSVKIPLKVIRFKSSENKVTGQFIFFAAHPTLFSAKNFRFSADFPGVLTRLLEEKSPDSIAIFANGAAGDLRPRAIDFRESAERVEHFGKTLFDLMHTIEFKSNSLEGEWASISEWVKLPNVKIRVSFLTIPSILGNRFFPTKTYFQVLRLGELMMVALPGEVSSEIGSEMEERIRANGFKPFLIGYANDFIGYIVPRRYYLDRSQYESSASFYGPKLDFYFQETVDHLIEKLTNQKSERFFTRKPGTLLKNKEIPILFLRGNSYELGYEHGKLMSKEIQAAKRQIDRYLNHKLYVPVLSGFIMKQILSNKWKKMEPFVSYDEWKELQGLSDGSGLSLKDVKRLHAIPDFIESLCTNGVYFKNATKNGKLIHIRNLDWLREMGVHHFAALLVYQPDSGNQFVNIGFYGFTGSLSGVNEHGISVGQAGADSIDETFKGTPMPFLMKRVLRRAKNLDDAVNIITKGNRTSSFNYVFADAMNQKTIAIETTAHHFQIFHDNDPAELNSGYGFPMLNVIVRSDSAFDPTIRNLQTCSHGNPKKPGIEKPSGSAYEIRYVKQSELVRSHYGEITPDIAREIAQAIAPDSNIQSVVYQFPDFWVANATDELPAARTEYRHFNFNDLIKRGEALEPAGEKTE